LLGAASDRVAVVFLVQGSIGEGYSAETDFVCIPELGAYGGLGARKKEREMKMGPAEKKSLL
jgi:hypothetical protein